MADYAPKEPFDTIFSQSGFSESIPVAPKRLVICCDGTWQSSVSGLKNIPSNITRLARSIARSGKEGDKIWQQIVYYDAGIGTGDLSNTEKDRQGGFGIGFVGNVIEAYNFLVLNYSPGDQIFCFGFSRGAYTARAVAGLVNDIGIISPRDMQDFPDLYALYQQNEDSQGFRKSVAYREWVWGVLSEDQPPKDQWGSQGPPRYRKPPHRSAPEASRVVEVVGVFDTVGSLGIPDMTWTQWNLKFLEGYFKISKPGFHNVSLSPYIRHAFHALAIDEHRGPFSPTLWHFPAASDRSPEKSKKTQETLRKELFQLHSDKNATQKELTAAWGALIDREMYDQLQDMESHLLQVWFPGVHINIGGGSDDLLNEGLKGDFEQIALITFAWMCEQIAPYLQLTAELSSLAMIAVEDRSKLIYPVLERIAKGEKDYGSNWVTSKAWKLLDKTGVKKAQVIHSPLEVMNGWATGPIVDSFAGLMATAGSIPRTPGQYREVKTGKELVKLGRTNEKIHPSVKYRMLKDASYKPIPLKGFERSLQQSKNEYEWKNGEVVIPEFLIKPQDVFTRYVAGQDGNLEKGASDFIARIDRDVGASSSERLTLDIREKSKGSGDV